MSSIVKNCHKKIIFIGVGFKKNKNKQKVTYDVGFAFGSAIRSKIQSEWKVNVSVHLTNSVSILEKYKSNIGVVTGQNPFFCPLKYFYYSSMNETVIYFINIVKTQKLL